VTHQVPDHREQALGHDGGHGHRGGIERSPAHVHLLGAGVDGLVRLPGVVVARLLYLLHLLV
jgi:hypothetical protein